MRLGFGGLLMLAHGWGKLVGFGARAPQFADPFGLGPTASLVLTVFAEFVCSALVAVGLFTRLAAIPPLIVMLTAFFLIHATDPFNVKERALIFLIGFLAIFLAGPGRYSLDAAWNRRRRR